MIICSVVELTLIKTRKPLNAVWLSKGKLWVWLPSDLIWFFKASH